ncbi:3-phenylpropionate/trans-cinnamate dioxygenase ferredoxin subunit [Mucilaginibacter yixingensis]|uniref:3-phenylpropionate/trans-cinnamate dioxygenase ferredoxin subunit n=1 Tax=Mucilaginibacter yixingensis TaxID=1295612 RepID=A0A2T5J9M1_9SPHI|nr:Rieske 2Fe-2S domain-containing protein [Mucilaginibacter yixingensis]PTQ96773.1 3-phenylpropionate/trans-cinnamate dioxygenase ferredoxin subunit [Mucilaginibacter yixingensis]
MNWFKVPGVVYTQEPFIKKVVAGGKSLCLVGYNGEVFALASRCPHAQEDISRGWCKDGKLVCPIHRFSYDLQTGRGSPGQNDFIHTYPVKIKTNEIYVGFNTWKENLINLFK